LFHYTNDKGYKAISSQVVWLFRASKLPDNHPKAAYFSTLPPGTKNLGKRLFVRGCAEKTKFVFSFSGGEDYSGPRKLDHRVSYSDGPGKGNC
jgi:hypothetical protein